MSARLRKSISGALAQDAIFALGGAIPYAIYVLGVLGVLVLSFTLLCGVASI